MSNKHRNWGYKSLEKLLFYAVLLTSLGQCIVTPARNLTQSPQSTISNIATPTFMARPLPNSQVETTPAMTYLFPTTTQVPVTPLPSMESHTGFNIEFIPVMTLTATVRDYQGWNRDALRQFDWSSDNQKLVFQNGARILIASAPDFAPYEIAQIKGIGVAQPHWNPDNHKIVFVDDANPYKILRLVDWTSATVSTTFSYSDTQESDRLIGFGKDIRIMKWLDDKRIAFSAMRGTDEANSLLVLTIDSKQITELSGIGNIFWAPDNTQYVTKRMFYDELQWHSLSQNDQTIPMTIGSSPHIERWFESWAPDSKRFVYTEWAKGSRIFSEDSHPTLYLWDIRELNAISLIQDVFGASWSPVEEQLAFYLLGPPQFDVENKLIGSSLTSTSSLESYFGVLDLTNQNILLMQPTGKLFKEQQHYVDVWFQTRKPMWSPNGKYIIYWGQNDILWLATLNERSIKQLTYNLSIIQVAWSLDSCYLSAGTTEHLYILSFCK